MQLERDYVVTRRDGLQADPDLRVQDVLEVVRLIPVDDGAALTVALTSLPGVRLRFGRWGGDGHVPQ